MNTFNVYIWCFSGIYLTDNSDVGIGVSAPANKLDVEGAMAIGSNYSGTNTAPTNGLIVEGNVGIGSSSSSYPLYATASFYVGFLITQEHLGVITELEVLVHPVLVGVLV